MPPQNASAARGMFSEVLETIRISRYMYLKYLYVVFSVSEYSYPMLFLILFLLPCILGLSEQYITTTSLIIDGPKTSMATATPTQNELG